MNITDTQSYLKAYPEGAPANVRRRIRKGFFETYGNPYLSRAKWPKAIETLDAGFSAIDMLESCFAYYETQTFYSRYYDQYKEQYLAAGGEKEGYDELIKTQAAYLEGCKPVPAGSDTEGNVYNAIVRK